MKRIMAFLLIVLLAVALQPAPGYAGSSEDMLAKVTSDSYLTRAPWRLMHGIVNGGLGWTRLFTGTKRVMSEENGNFVDGIATGVSETLYFTVAGVWDIATFWYPGEGGKEIAVRDCVFSGPASSSSSGEAK